MNNSRYIVQKLIEFDIENKLEVWRNTSIRSDNIGSLMNFISDDYRIYDLKMNVVVKRSKKRT